MGCCRSRPPPPPDPSPEQIGAAELHRQREIERYREDAASRSLQSTAQLNTANAAADRGAKHSIEYQPSTAISPIDSEKSAGPTKKETSRRRYGEADKPSRNSSVDWNDIREASDLFRVKPLKAFQQTKALKKVVSKRSNSLASWGTEMTPGSGNRRKNNANVPPQRTTLPPSQPGLQTASPEGLEQLCEQLWELSERFEMNNDYKISEAIGDEFISNLHKRVLERGTIRLFLKLTDAIQASADSGETTNSEKSLRVVEKQFLDALMGTRVLQACHRRAVEQGWFEGSRKDFRKRLRRVWFTRQAETRQSAFQHVFVGVKKPKQNTMAGMHNWLRYYQLRQAGRVVFGGVVGRNSTIAVTIRFQLDGSTVGKNHCSFFLGTTPEFEVALYTVLYLVAQYESSNLDRNNSRLGAEGRVRQERQFELRLDSDAVCVTLVTMREILITVHPRDCPP